MSTAGRWREAALFIWRDDPNSEVRRDFLDLARAVGGKPYVIPTQRGIEILFSDMFVADQFSEMLKKRLTGYGYDEGAYWMNSDKAVIEIKGLSFG